MVCKPAQLLQNRHFAEKFFGPLTKIFGNKNFGRKKCLCRRKMKCRGSPETRFPEVWGRSEPSSGGKRPFEVSQIILFGSSKIRMAVYPRRMAPIGLKLWENAFQVIPDIWFFDAQSFFSTKMFVGKICSSTPRKTFQQSACFGGAVQVWTLLADAPRKFIARHIGFSLLRPLAEG